jgi:hypothetical protein
MMAKRKILICDDRPASIETWQRRLESVAAMTSNFQIETLDTAEAFASEIKKLEARRESVKNWSDDRDWPEGTATAFDDADILVIDFDLYELSKGATGERISYLARCYSNCGVIVALNQFLPAGFDLRLTGHPDSFADLNISSDWLDNAGLWSDAFKGFRPWLWPLLPRAVDQLEERARRLESQLDASIFNELGFADAQLPAFPRETEGFIEGRRTRAEKVSFDTFVRESGNGLREGDRAPSKARARIAAARVAKWVERLVLPAQDAIVDAPHLASRFPSLLTGQRSKPSTWNRTAHLEREAEALGLDESKINRARAKNDVWFSRPVWFWSELANLPEITEVADPWSVIDPTLVFCEDVSRFLPREDTREFVAALLSPFTQRFVTGNTDGGKAARGSRSILYHPPGRFAR